MKKKIAELLASKIEQLDVEKVEQLLEVPPKADMGDYAFPCFQRIPPGSQLPAWEAWEYIAPLLRAARPLSYREPR